MVKGSGAEPWTARVGDLVLPAAVAGHPALELANTWAGWSPDGRELPGGREYLTSAAHLSALALDRGLLDVEPPPADADLLAPVRALRSASYRLLRGVGASDDDVALLGRLAAEARQHQRLVTRTAASGWRWELAAGAGSRAPLLAAAAAIADLLVHGAAERVRACPGEGCGWLFLDTSGRRRWCLMGVCGNRAKQRTFATRR